MKSTLQRLSRDRAFTYIAALVLLTAGVIVGIASELSYRQTKLRDISIQADILAQSVAAALMFNDDVAAQESATALSANPNIAAVGIYGANGKLLASYARASSLPPGHLNGQPNAAFRGAFVETAAPVLRDGQEYGGVFIRQKQETTLARFARYAPVGLLVFMGALVLAVAGAAQVALQDANAQLAGRAQALSVANEKLEDEIAQRKKAEEQLLQSRKLEAIGQLTGGVAHDFNNLLMVISGGLRVLQRENADPQRQRKVTEAMHQAVDRGAGLTRQLLAFARRQSLQLTAIDVERQISGMKELLERSLRADILLETEFPGALPPVETDIVQFELAILNLCVNARDAMPKGGLVKISAQRSREAPGAFVEVVVSDTGSGISPEVLERVFEPYFTTKGLGEGTGLGLSQVYGFVQQNGGTIRIDTEVSRGTSIILSLPISKNQPLAPEDFTHIAAEDSATTRSILVVEDDEQVAETVFAMLEELGHSPTLVRSAPDALAVLEHKSDFDLLFSDIVMPGGKSGLDLAEEVTRDYPGLPILLTTGFSGRADLALQWPLLRKPYDIRQLADAIAARARKMA